MTKKKTTFIIKINIPTAIEFYNIYFDKLGIDRFLAKMLQHSF